MKFTAKISRNRRQISPSQSMILLRDIQSDEEDFRDHCWIEESKSLVKLLSTNPLFRRNSGNGSAIIQFEAEERLYYYNTGEVFKKTLSNVKNIRVLGRA
jgi:hypothetical protein